MANQIDERVKPFEVKMGKSIASLDSEFGTIRAGRANPHVLDRITVDYYGTPTPLQQVANISVPEARMIQIQPWEASLVKEIEKAIMMSDIGITPNNDGSMPMMRSRNLPKRTFPRTKSKSSRSRPRN